MIFWPLLSVCFSLDSFPSVHIVGFVEVVVVVCESDYFVVAGADADAVGGGCCFAGDAPQICRMALDTETMEGQPDRDTFLGVFYEHYVHWLVEPFWLGDLSSDGELQQFRSTVLIYFLHPQGG